MHVHIVRRHLIKEEHLAETAVFGSPVALGFTLAFLVSVPLAFVSTHLAQALWASTIVLRYPLRRLSGWVSASS